MPASSGNGNADGRNTKLKKLAVRAAIALAAIMLVGFIYNYLTRTARQEAIEWIEARGGTVSPILTKENWTIFGFTLPYERKSEMVIVEVLKLSLTEDEQEDLGFYLRSLGGIDMLYLSGAKVDDGWMERIGEQDRIRSLQLSETSVSREQLQSVLEWNDLRAFYNLKNPGISEDDSQQLQTELSRRPPAY